MHLERSLVLELLGPLSLSAHMSLRRTARPTSYPQTGMSVENQRLLSCQQLKLPDLP
jgi:hypothetical protein